MYEYTNWVRFQVDKLVWTLIKIFLSDPTMFCESKVHSTRKEKQTLINPAFSERQDRDKAFSPLFALKSSGFAHQV